MAAGKQLKLLHIRTVIGWSSSNSLRNTLYTVVFGSSSGRGNKGQRDVLCKHPFKHSILELSIDPHGCKVLTRCVKPMEYLIVLELCTCLNSSATLAVRRFAEVCSGSQPVLLVTLYNEAESLGDRFT